MMFRWNIQSDAQCQVGTLGDKVQMAMECENVSALFTFNAKTARVIAAEIIRAADFLEIDRED